MPFTPTLIDLGELKPNKEVSLEFSYDDEIKLITYITSPCGCTRISNDIPNKKILVYFTPADVPFHIRKEGKNCYESAKTIKLGYLNTSNVELTQDLTFTVKIKR